MCILPETIFNFSEWIHGWHLFCSYYFQLSVPSLLQRKCYPLLLMWYAILYSIIIARAHTNTIVLHAWLILYFNWDNANGVNLYWTKLYFLLFDWIIFCPQMTLNWTLSIGLRAYSFYCHFRQVPSAGI